MINLIGISGRKGVGKDTAALALINNGYTRVSFATPLKLMLSALFKYVDVVPQTIAEMVDGNLKEMPTQYLEGASTRCALQTLGTEWGRNIIGKSFWINIGLAKAKLHEKVVITDVRFPNEAEAIRAAGGKVIKIERPVVVDDIHPSETHVDKVLADFIIMNTGTIDFLHHAVLEFAKGNNELR